MNVSNDESSLVVFRADVSAAENDESASPISADYCRQRERAERAAAKGCNSIKARRIHQELAQAYARLSRNGSAE